MGIIERFRQFAAPHVAKQYGKVLDRQALELDYMRESLSTVTLELENLNYQRLANFAPEYQYSPRHIRNIVRLSVQMALKNPVTVRSIKVQADYVFGQGVSFIAKHPLVQGVVDEFANYCENRKTLTSHTAMLLLEKRQQVWGSLFLTLNTNTQTGRVIVRNMPTLEVDAVIRDPQDAETEWYIKHAVTDADGKVLHVYHPALGITEYSGIPLPWHVRAHGQAPHEPGPILWDAPVLHIAANRLGQEEFAIPEVYPQLDWALSYKRTLEQYISIIASYARMAMKLSGIKGKKQAAAAKALLKTSTNISQPIEGNPSAVAGSTALFGQGLDIEPIKTAGATTPASDFDPILNFAGCAVGLPNTFFGDAGKGNFATAKTLDRPTELKMISRQKLWIETFTSIFEYVVLQACIAPDGILRQAGASYSEVQDVFTGVVIPQVAMPANTDAAHGEVGQPISTVVETKFPEVLERNVADRVRSLVNAVTLFGKPLYDVIPDKRLVALWLMQALNVPNPEQYIPGFVTMWEKNMNAEPGEPIEAIIVPPPAEKGGAGAEDPGQGGDLGDNG